MDLGGPVGLVAPGQTSYKLKAFHEVPPEGVQVPAIRVFVEGLLEAVHHQRPASEDEPICPAAPQEEFAIPL